MRKNIEKPTKASQVVLGMVAALENPKVDRRDMSSFGSNPTKDENFCIGCAATDYLLHTGFEKSDLNKGGITPKLFDTHTEFLYWEKLEAVIDDLRRGNLNSLRKLFYFPENFNENLPYLLDKYTQKELDKYKAFGLRLKKAEY